MIDPNETAPTAFLYLTGDPLDVDLLFQGADSYRSAHALPGWRAAGTMGDDAMPLRPGVFFDSERWTERSPLNRPEWERLDSLLRPGDHVLVPALSDLFRRLADVAVTVPHLSRLGVTIHFLRESLVAAPGGRFSSALAIWKEWDGMFREAKRAGREAWRELGLHRQPAPCRLAPVPAEYTGPPADSARVFPYFQCSVFDAQMGAVPFERQVPAVTETAREIAASTGGIVAPIQYDNAWRTAEVPFLNRPAAKQILSDSRPGDHIVVFGADAAFFLLSDLLPAIQWTWARGVTLHLAELGLNFDSREGFEIATALAWVESLRDGLAPRSAPIPSYLKRQRIHGKTVLLFDPVPLAVVRNVRVLASRGAPAEAIRQRLEVVEAKILGDGVVLPISGYDTADKRVRKIHPDHGRRFNGRIASRWTLQEAERIRTEDYWRELDRLAAEKRFIPRRKPLWPPPLPGGETSPA